MSTPEGNLEVLNHLMIIQGKYNYIEVIKNNTENMGFAFRRTLKTLGQLKKTGRISILTFYVYQGLEIIIWIKKTLPFNRFWDIITFGSLPLFYH